MAREADAIRRAAHREPDPVPTSSATASASAGGGHVGSRSVMRSAHSSPAHDQADPATSSHPPDVAAEQERHRGRTDQLTQRDTRAAAARQDGRGGPGTGHARLDPGGKPLPFNDIASARRASGPRSPVRGRRPTASTPPADPNRGLRADRPRARSPAATSAPSPARAATARQSRPDRAVGLVGGDVEGAHRMRADPQFADQNIQRAPAVPGPRAAVRRRRCDAGGAHQRGRRPAPRRTASSAAEHTPRRPRRQPATAARRPRGAPPCAVRTSRRRGDGGATAAPTPGQHGRHTIPVIGGRSRSSALQVGRAVASPRSACHAVTGAHRAGRPCASTAISPSRRRPSRPRPTCSSTCTAAAS